MAVDNRLTITSSGNEERKSSDHPGMMNGEYRSAGRIDRRGIMPDWGDVITR